MSKSRKQLGKRINQRLTFVGRFNRLGTKRGYYEDVETVLLTDITTAKGKPICDHLWFNLTKGFMGLELKKGDRIQFDARVKEYTKGYFGRREEVESYTDYKLSHPTKLVNLDAASKPDEVIDTTKR